MNKYDLSVLIPSRNEMFVSETVNGILANIRGNTEVIVVLDGEWAFPAIQDAPNLTILYVPESIGQRAATNQAARLSNAKYVMKLDAHCVVDEGFDVKIMADMQDDWTIVPLMKNLHAFNWRCVGKRPKSGKLYIEHDEFPQGGCGYSFYQGPTPEKCKECGGNMERDLIWIAKDSPKSTSFCFDTTLHFQYFKQFEKREEWKNTELTETFSLQGSCFMLTREKYWELNICDENFGSWGQQGVEVALKTWLSGGKVICSRKTWYAHMFRTQGGDFGFPYHISGRQVDHARKFSRDLFFENTWDKQIHPLSWLLKKFNPVPYWHTEPYVDNDEKKAKEMVDYVNKRGEEFRKPQGVEVSNQPQNLKTYKKEIIFYTDNQLKLKYAHIVQDTLRKVGLPIISASLKPMPHFGKNVHIPLQRGLEAYFRQIISALEASDADIVYMCEADVIYHPSHFDFIPPREDKFYYNLNFWRIRPEKDNFAVHWDANQVSGLCGYREHILQWYKNKWKQIQETGFDRSYEPGGRDTTQYENWRSTYPNIDIRHGNNLTKSKWSLDDFRDKSTSAGWQESTLEKIPGWDKEFLLQLM